ncbi:MAG: AI-2E family transporter [Chitinophagales bacterium]
MVRKYPFYIRCTVILFGLVLLVYSLSNLRGILIPLFFAFMLAILLNPLVNRFQRWKLPRVLAIAIALLISIILLSGISYLIYSQMASFSDQLPLLKTRLLKLLEKAQMVASTRFHLNISNQNELINQAEGGLKSMIGQTLSTLTIIFEMLFLIPFFGFLILYYKTLILDFLYEIFAEENAEEVGMILNQTKGAIQRYMLGLLFETLIVAFLNSIALMALSLEYAILLGIVGALLNLLPIIGGILEVLLPLLIATITKDGFGTQMGIIIAYVVIRFIDNHILVPYIVSSKVKINALISTIVVLLGWAVWGVSGMFLAIPFIGVLKIIFDRIPELKPWGKLFGNEFPITHKGEIWNRIKKTIALP